MPADEDWLLVVTGDELGRELEILLLEAEDAELLRDRTADEDWELLDAWDELGRALEITLLLND